MSDWFRPLDPTGNIPGLRSRYVPRGGEAFVPSRPAAPPCAAPEAPPPVVEPAQTPAVVQSAPARGTVFLGAHLGASTLRGRVVAALGTIESETMPRSHWHPGVTTADLVVRAWRLWPEVFGLAGHAHPDSNRVLAKLCGASGLISAGWIERTDAGRYRLTAMGRRWCRERADAVPRGRGGR